MGSGSVATAFSIVLALLPVAGLAAPAGGETSSTETPGAAAQSAQPTVEQRLDALDRRTDHLDDFDNKILLPLSVLVGLLTAGGVVGLVTSLRYERRQSQLHELGVGGEMAAQARAEQSHVSFLAGSQQTLTLVNDTLTLAKQASDRAAEAMEQQAKDSLSDIDMRAKSVLDRVYLERDFKAIVKPNVRHDLVEIAHDLASIEGYLKLQGMRLNPRCFFVKGLERHLRPEPRSAIRNFLAAQTDEDRNLTAHALFWAGYISNNRGEYRQALDSFSRAQDLAEPEGPQRIDLERIHIETRFFERAAAPAPESRRDHIADLEHDLRSVLDRVDPKSPDLAHVRAGCRTTLANLLVWVGRLSPLERAPNEPLSGVEREALEAAVQLFEEAAAEEPPGRDLWPLFGALQIKAALGQATDRSNWSYVLKEAEAQRGGRVERRTQALLYETILISLAQLHPDDWEGRRHVRSDLRTALSELDEDTTVYSQWQKRNVSLRVFEKELDTGIQVEAPA